MTTEKSMTPWYFLGVVILTYVIFFFFNKELIITSLDFFMGLIIKIIPSLILIFFLMGIINYFVDPNTLVRYMGKNSGVKGWIISIISGIISTGPIYLWYPLLSDLQEQGVKNSLLSTFLYARAVKIPLLPLLITYFGIPYVIILNLSIIIFSVPQGYLTEKVMEVKR